MELKILKLHETLGNTTDYWCEDEDGRKIIVDIITSGDLIAPDDPRDLIGKSIEVDCLTAYIEIAHGVRIVGQ